MLSHSNSENALPALVRASVINLSPVPWLSMRPLPFRFTHHKPVYIFLLPLARYLLRILKDSTVWKAGYKLRWRSVKTFKGWGSYSLNQSVPWNREQRGVLAVTRILAVFVPQASSNCIRKCSCNKLVLEATCCTVLCCPSVLHSSIPRSVQDKWYFVLNTIDKKA